VANASRWRLSGCALQDGFEVVELCDLVAHLPGDHRGHELHEPGWLEVEGEPDPGAVVGVFCQLEHAGGARWSGGDVESELPGRIEDGDAVVAVDAASAWPGEDLAVGGSLAVSG
jgi:hypothetical protein